MPSVRLFVCLPVYLFVRRRNTARHLSILTLEALRLPRPCQCSVKYKLTRQTVDFTAAAIVLFNATGTHVANSLRRVLDNTHFSLFLLGSNSYVRYHGDPEYVYFSS